MRAGGLQLEDLFDVELQLLRDRDAARQTLRERDRRIGLAVGDRPRPELLREWVRTVQREESRESAGERLVRAYHGLGWLLVLLGLSSGAGTAAAVLAYDGTRPVNVVHFLAIFVALQLVLLTLFLLSGTLWRFRDRLPAIEGVYGLLRLAVGAMARLLERRLSAERRSAIGAARGRLKASRIIYGQTEHWLLVALAQRFGLSFNLGALATCLYLVAFSDLAFAWQTTLAWSAEDFHRAMSLLAAPWSWLYPEGLPTLDVVRASRYFRLGGTFGGAPHAELLGQWWRFLVLCLLTYGLLPRLALSIFSGIKLRRSLAGIRLDHAEIAALVERLTSPLVQTRSPQPESAPPPATAPVAPAAVARDSGDATVILWGDVPADPAALIEGRLGWRVGSVAAAGAEDTNGDRAAIEAASAAPSPIVIVAEAFEPPTREARTFLERLRAAAGAHRAIVVGLVGDGAPPAAGDVAIWERHLAALGDPYLRVETLP